VRGVHDRLTDGDGPPSAGKDTSLGLLLLGDDDLLADRV
jgi:hypothetical protein